MGGGLALQENRKTSNKTAAGMARPEVFILDEKLRAVIFSFITFVLISANPMQDQQAFDPVTGDLHELSCKL